MSNILKVIIFGTGISLCVWVIMLLVRKKINERNTLVWISGVIAVLLLSANPEWLNVAADWTGVSYPPSLLFLCSFIVLLIMTLYQSIQISQLYAKLKDVSQAIALLNKEDETNRNGEG